MGAGSMALTVDFFAGGSREFWAPFASSFLIWFWLTDAFSAVRLTAGKSNASIITMAMAVIVFAFLHQQGVVFPISLIFGAMAAVTGFILFPHHSEETLRAEIYEVRKEIQVWREENNEKYVSLLRDDLHTISNEIAYLHDPDFRERYEFWYLVQRVLVALSTFGVFFLLWRWSTK